ncbi:ABC transporter ATP-binding protein [Candidatus Uhrbacteria bacterium]|nr:ABC transporter ATP-binding protein [Candidatus Uhrbacteria bacterium]
MSIIEVKKLSKTYTYHRKAPGLWASVKSLFHREKLYTHAVKDISFSVEEGELVGFLGPNGAGKTTTLKMLSGILYPTGGEARVLGYVPWERRKEYQKQFAIVMGQKNQLWWDLPAMESFILNKEIYEVPEKQFRTTLDELVDLLDVRDILDVQVRKLSLGQRMKCELIAALLHAPRVLFLDEPTIGLDVVSQQNMREFIRKYNALKKTTILLTSHYMEDVEALCKRVIIINHGQIIYDGLLADLVDKYVDHKIITVSFKKEVQKKDLEKLGEIREYKPQYVVLEIKNDHVRERAAKILTTMPVDDILIDEAPVEEVIRKIFEEVAPRK